MWHFWKAVGQKKNSWPFAGLFLSVLSLQLCTGGSCPSSPWLPLFSHSTHHSPPLPFSTAATFPLLRRSHGTSQTVSIKVQGTQGRRKGQDWKRQKGIMSGKAFSASDATMGLSTPSGLLWLSLSRQNLLWQQRKTPNRESHLLSSGWHLPKISCHGKCNYYLLSVVI